MITTSESRRLADVRPCFFSFAVALEHTAILALALAVLAGCSEELEPPVAVIGAPATAIVGEVVNLDGSQSYDPGGGTVSFSWGFVGVPAGSRAELNDPNLVNPFFVADVRGTYTVVLVVHNGDTPSTATMATIEVSPCGTYTPTIEEVVVTPATPNTGDRVVLSITADDLDNHSDGCGFDQLLLVESRFASRPPGSTALLAPTEGATPAFAADLPGNYTIRVTVTDDTGLSSSEDVVVSVSDCGDNPPVATLTSQPIAPVVGQRVVLMAEVEDADLWDGTEEDTCRLDESFTYQWSIVDAPAGSMAAIANPGAANSGFTPDVAGEYRVECRVRDLAGHLDAKTLTVLVAEDDSPEVSVSATPNAGLTPLSVQFTCESSEGEPPFSYYWTLGNGVTTAEQNPWFTYTSGGVYSATCMVTDSNGDTGLDSVTVDVEQDTTPQVLITAEPTSGLLDEGQFLVAFNSFVSLGNVSPETGLTYAWDFGDEEFTDSDKPNPDHTYTEGGRYVVVLAVTDADGDVGTDTLQISVGPDSIPMVAASADPIEGISPVQVQFQADVAGGNPPISWTWDFGVPGTTSDTSVQQNPVYTYDFTGAGSYYDYEATLTGIDADGDVSADSTVTIRVWKNTVPVVEVEPESDGDLTPFQVDFTCTVTGGNAPLSYYWEFGDGTTSTVQNPSHTYETGGEFVASCTVTDANSDSHTDTSTITVELDTVPSVVISADALTGYADLDVAFSATATGGNGTLTYDWDYGDGESALGAGDSVNHSYTSPGVYRVVVTVEDEQGDIGTDSVQIAVGTNSEPVVAASADPIEGIEPVPVQFHADVAGGNPPIRFNWDFGVPGTTADTSVQQNPNYTYHFTEAGSYYDYVATVTGTDADGDVSAPSTVTVRVWKDADPFGTVSISTTPAAPTGVAPFLVEFECSASAGNEPFSYLWDFGDGHTSHLPNPTHVYLEHGTYTARCTVTDANGDSGTNEDNSAPPLAVTVLPDTLPVVSISADPISGIMPDEEGATFDVQFTSTVSGGNGELDYRWDFGAVGTSTQTDPVVEFASAGIYPVILTVTDEDADVGTDTLTVAIEADIDPFVSASGNPAAGRTPLQVQFSAVGYGNQPLTYTWDFEFDSETFAPDSYLQSPIYTYTVAGTYIARVRVTDGDDETAFYSVPISVSERDTVPNVAIAANPTEGYTPHTVYFGSSVNGGNGPWMFRWTFGDGETETALVQDLDAATPSIFNPTYTYYEDDPPATLIARLTVTDIDGDVGTDSIVINIPNRDPVAIATPLRTCLEIGDWVQLDGSSSYDPDPQELTFEWIVGYSPEGSTYRFEPSAAATSPLFTADTLGVYAIVLAVSDGVVTDYSYEDDLAEIVLVEIGEVLFMADRNGTTRKEGSVSATIEPPLGVDMMIDCPYLYDELGMIPESHEISWSGYYASPAALTTMTLKDGHATYTGGIYGPQAGPHSYSWVVASYNPILGDPLEITFDLVYITCGTDTDCVGDYCNPDSGLCEGPWFVDDDAPDGGLGTSWEDAFNDLQVALTTAAGGGIEAIWMAEGEYSPGTERADTFSLDQVTILGGFAGTELYPEDRLFHPDTGLFDVHETVLSGNDNNYSVVEMLASSQVTVQGITIAGGNADETGTGGPQYGNGGGLYATDISRVKFANVAFVDNYGYLGGGLYIQPMATGVSQVSFDHCLFDINQAEDGAGAYIQDVGSFELSIHASSFTDNLANRDGGGLYIGDSAIEIDKSRFEGNQTSTQRGGGIIVVDSLSNPTITNTLFIDNISATNGGGIAASTPASMNVVNSTFHGNQAAAGGGQEVYAETGASSVADPSLYNNIFSSTTSDCIVVPEDQPRVQYNVIADTTSYWCEDTTNLCEAPIFAEPASHDFHLVYNSPGIDMGTDEEPYYTPYDFDGNPRVGESDIGAYEFQTIWINEIHYDNEGTDVNEGFEIAGPMGFDFTDWLAQVYDGGGTAIDHEFDLTLAVYDDEENGVGVFWIPVPGLENGVEGIALVAPDDVVIQFISWEGSFTPSVGQATDIPSVDIIVDEDGATPVDTSLSLAGSGRTYGQFSWKAEVPQTMDEINYKQSIEPLER